MSADNDESDPQQRASGDRGRSPRRRRPGKDQSAARTPPSPAVVSGSTGQRDRLEQRARRRGALEELRVIAKIASFHRSAHQSSLAPTPPRTTGETSPTAEQSPAAFEWWGELVLIEEVGVGSFGVVYRAYDPQLERPVAVKLLRRASSGPDDSAVVAELLHEARTLAQVRHPNVVTVYGAGEHDGRPGLWMEFIRGATLEQMLISHGAFSAQEIALIGCDVCSAVAAVHRAGLVHRDIKAQNVMREEGGRLVLMDFGAGRTEIEIEALRGRVIGTPIYLAPEVFEGHATTTRSDIYSLGVLLFHLATNDFPVKGSSFHEIAAAQARGEITSLLDVRPDLPAAFVRVVERATHPDPAKRFESIGRMRAALTTVGNLADTRAIPRLRASKRRSARRALATPRERAASSVAVLPFVDMSAAKDQECFCDGLAEELIAGLSQIRGLHVAARTSAFRFKSQVRDVRQIGFALNVEAILDGSVRKQGDQLRITVELIASSNGYVLWSQRFDRRVEDVFKVQDEIARSVVATLQGKLASAAPFVSLLPGVTDLAAYTAYLEGRYHWNKRTPEELEKSVECFERATAREPGFAAAHAAMADAYVTLGTYGCLPSKDVMPKASQAIDRALAVAPNLAEAYACRGCVRAVIDWAWASAEEDFRRAIELSPGYALAHHWYAINLLVPVGRFGEAIASLHRALDLDPLALPVKTSMGMQYYFSRRYEEAVQELTRTLDLDEHFGTAHLFLAASLTELARYDEARGEFRDALRDSGDSPEILAGLGYLYGVSGDAENARATLDRLTTLASDRYVSPVRLAEVHVGLGDAASALELLQQARSERAADLAWAAVRPTFARLHGEPGFEQILREMGLTAVASVG
jgi:serine/threonine-protein kinase